MFEAGLRPAEGMKCNRGGGFLSWTRAGSWPSEMGVKEGSRFMGISGTFLGRVVLERLLGYSSKSVHKNPGVGYHALLQGIFPTQGSNLGLLHLRQILY